jgi:hypothetical protein
MLALWVGLQVLAVSPSLHRLLHNDAQEPLHECVVKELSHHSPLVDPPASPLIDPPHSDLVLQSLGLAAEPQAAWCASTASRAPPAANLAPKSGLAG